MHTTIFGTETRAYFPVTLQPVYIGDEAQKAGEYHAVVREDTGDVLGIHRGSYRLVPNREVFEPFEEAILRSGIPVEGLEVHEGLAYRGRTVVREYIFPQVALEPRIGDVVEFKLLVVNSYDGTNAFRAVMAGRRRLCLNGLVGEERKAQVYARHTSGFSSERAIEGSDERWTATSRSMPNGSAGPRGRSRWRRPARSSRRCLRPTRGAFRA